VAYTARKPELAPPSAELRQKIVGWGVDLDVKNRPGVPKENFNPGATGAHWDFPERQIQRYPRERSIEHKFLTPVFGTACPPRGLSGVIRRAAYRRFSEARIAHWALLVMADRIDVFENGLKALVSGRPDNPFTERGLSTEFTHHGIRSRVGRGRADVKHLPVDLLLFAGTGLAAGALLYAIGRRLTAPARSRRRLEQW
jgi:hypothetical protein